MTHLTDALESKRLTVDGLAFAFVVLSALVACGRSPGSSNAKDAMPADGEVAEAAASDLPTVPTDGQTADGAASDLPTVPTDGQTADDAASNLPATPIDGQTVDGAGIDVSTMPADSQPADNAEADVSTVPIDSQTVDGPGSDRSTGAGPVLTMTPSALDLGKTVVGVSIGPKTFKVTNIGTTASGAVVVGLYSNSTILGASQFAYTTTCQAPLAPGESCDIVVTFKPTLSGSASAIVRASDGTVWSEDRTVVGLALSDCSIKEPCPSTTFEDTLVGQTSAAIVCTISNSSDRPRDAGALTVATVGDFAISQNNCSVFPAPGTACTFSLVFKPTAKGPQSGMLTVAGTNGCAMNQTLDGTGLGLVEIQEYEAACSPSQSPPCRIKANGPTASYDFGTVSVGDTSATQVILAVFVRAPVGTLTVTTGFGTPADFAQDAAASIAWATDAGDTVIGPCQPVQTIAAVPAKAVPYCTMLVRFAPQSTPAPAKTGIVTATGGDGTSDRAAMHGTAHGPLSISPSLVVFETAAPGTASATTTVTVCNHAPTAASNVHVTITGPNANDFVVVLDQVSNGSVNPNGACDQILSLRLDVPRTETATVLTASLAVSATVGGVDESDSTDLVGGIRP